MKLVSMPLSAAGAALAGVLLLGVAFSANARAGDVVMIKKGHHLFNQMCSHCHGINMVNPGNSSFDLRKFPPNEEARFRHSVTKGKNNMPAWGDILKPVEIDELWAYISSGGHS